MKNRDFPKYKNDILDQLRHHDGCPAIIRLMEDITGALSQHLSRAELEIDKLRTENKKLKKKIQNEKAI